MVNSSQLTELTFRKTGLRDIFNNDPDLVVNLKDNNQGSAKFNILSNGLYKISDGIAGHIVYIEYGDSISLQLDELNNLMNTLKNGQSQGYFNTLKASGKFAWHYLFFDELARRTKKLYILNKNELENNLLDFKNRCENGLTIGIELLDSLYSKKLVNSNFKKIAEQELNAIYVSRLCLPLSAVPKRKIQLSYFDRISNLKFNDSSYSVMGYLYLQAGSLLTYYIYNDFNTEKLYSNLYNELSSIQKNFTGIIKENLLTQQVSDYLNKDYDGFDSCFSFYLSICTNEKMKSNITKKAESLKNKFNNFDNIPIETLLSSTKIEDKKGIAITLLSLMKDSLPLLIDCWASWCIPCREQMPFINEIEVKYKGKLKVIYISFDQDELAWKQLLEKKENPTNQYLMVNSFNSTFSKYFKLEEIPRYILIDKGGNKVLSKKLPLPSQKTAFSEQLNKFIGLE